MMSEQARSTPIKVFQKKKKLCSFSAFLLVLNQTKPSFDEVQSFWRDKTLGPGVQILKSSKFSFSLFRPWVGFISGQKNSAKVWVFFRH